MGTILISAWIRLSLKAWGRNPWQFEIVGFRLLEVIERLLRSRWSESAFAALVVGVSALKPAWLPVFVGIGFLLWKPENPGSLRFLLPALAVMAMAALLPPWMPLPWVDALSALPGTISPQPWVLIYELPVFFSGLVFLWWCCGREQGFAARQAVVCAIASLGCLGMILTAEWHSGAWQGPFAGLWESPFETRNQASSFAAALAAACWIKMASPSSHRMVWGGLAIISTIPVFQFGSRGAAAALLLGLGAGVALLLKTRHPNPKVWLSVGCGALAIFLMATTLPLAGRIQRDGLSGWETRWSIQNDACQLIQAFPWTGVGLGNFECVFPFFRSSGKAMHPESDWLWLCSEAGLIAGFLTGGIVAVLGFRLWKKSDQALSLMAPGIAALVVVGSHGFLDVPAHSLPVLFLVVALAGTAPAQPIPASRACSVFGFALALFGLATWIWNPPPRPETYAPHKPMTLPPEAGIRAYLMRSPLDVGVLELALHHAILKRRESDAEQVLRRMLVLEPYSTDFLFRAYGRCVETAATPLARELAVEILKRAKKSSETIALRQLLLVSPPPMRHLIFSLHPKSAEAQAFLILQTETSPSSEALNRFFALARDPQDPGVSMKTGMQILERTDALEMASSVPALKKPLQGVLARQAARSGTWDSANARVMALDSLDRIFNAPSSPNVHRAVIQEIRNGNLSRARVLLATELSRQADNPDSWYLLGCAEVADAAPERAWIAFDKFLELTDNDSHASR